MAENWVDGVADELRRWADARDAAEGGRGGEAVDVRGVVLLLDLAREELGLADAADLTPDLLRRLMLEVFPGSVVADGEEAPEVVRAARCLLAYLRESGAVTAGAADALEDALDRLVPEFEEVVAAADGEERRAAAELITGMMMADGVPVDDEDAVDRWVRDFEALPEEERYARTEEYLREAEERIVPPVRLAPEAEVAAAARASALTGEVRALAAWTDGGRPVDEFGDLGAADAVAAAESLGLATPRRSPAVESQADLPELDRLWWAAVDAGVIAEAGGTATPGPNHGVLDGPDDAAMLDVWVRVFDGVAVPGHDPEDGLDAVRLVQNELTGVLLHLYEQEAPTPPEELAELLVGHVMEAYEVGDAAELAGAVAAALALEIDDLTRWGVLDGAGEGHVLTPLGVWAVRELLLADGFAAPVVGELADAPAAALVSGLAWHRQDTADEEITGWLEGRDAEAAARELLEVMRTGGPGARNLAAAVLQRVGPEAAGVVREASEERPVRPYAVLWLDRLAEGTDGGGLGRDDYLWLFVDTVAGMLETAEPRDAVAAAVTDAPAGADLTGMVEEMWRADHPGVVDVLAALGAHHPDRAIAKAARTAAYKARSVRSPS
ncbi:hypothetical protein Acsp03_10190 [Actinomadura sp. NBRC 104412]|uniref:hypothetical protein n=1 Tax=Actinomadura sp. NBRC 104412 TaxID=3032203 RepID=UPI0024A16C8B|nr:hypothetical protein [Actinomadura sp. NBRC 104412]GLZ03552.1 hypothetical protein Acsp03_10190 [Actinomadura sp. NBRC 104412]